nr:MAG TPA_asm: hypothetical protein [Caudoviricetes sp.]
MDKCPPEYGYLLFNVPTLFIQCVYYTKCIDLIGQAMLYCNYWERYIIRSYTC